MLHQETPRTLEEIPTNAYPLIEKLYAATKDTLFEWDDIQLDINSTWQEYLIDRNIGQTKYANYDVAILCYIAVTEENIIKHYLPKEISFDWENYEQVKFGTSNKNTPYILMYAGGDWETPVYFAIFLNDKDEVCMYTPFDGNMYNTTTDTAYGNADDEEDEKDFTSRFGKRLDEWTEPYESIDLAAIELEINRSI